MAITGTSPDSSSMKRISGTGTAGQLIRRERLLRMVGPMRRRPILTLEAQLRLQRYEVELEMLEQVRSSAARLPGL